MLKAHQLPDPNLPWPLPLPQVYEIASDEQGPGGGVALVAYLCPAQRWTCGWGETEGVGPKTRWTKEYADQRLCDGLTYRAERVRQMCAVEPTDNQLSALVRISYNIGLGYDPSKPAPKGARPGLWNSSIMRAHNRGDFIAAAEAFKLWNKATVNGQLKVLPGLVTRRAREAALYLTPDEGGARLSMPQAVAPEPSLVRSPTMTLGGAVPTATGLLAAVNEVTKPEPTPAAAPAPVPTTVESIAQAGQQASTVQTALGQIKSLAVDHIGLPANYWLPLILVISGALVMWRRYKQRLEGKA